MLIRCCFFLSRKTGCTAWVVDQQGSTSGSTWGHVAACRNVRIQNLHPYNTKISSVHPKISIYVKHNKDKSSSFINYLKQKRKCGKNKEQGQKYDTKNAPWHQMCSIKCILSICLLSGKSVGCLSDVPCPILHMVALFPIRKSSCSRPSDASNLLLIFFLLRFFFLAG